MSPYPMVVSVMMPQYMLTGMDEKPSMPSAPRLPSTRYMRVAIKIRLTNMMTTAANRSSPAACVKYMSRAAHK